MKSNKTLPIAAALLSLSTNSVFAAEDSAPLLDEIVVSGSRAGTAI